MLKVMLIGAFPPPVGGTTVSLLALDEYLTRSGTIVHRVDCAVRGDSQLGVLIVALWRAWREAPRCDVLTLHLSDRATSTAGPLFWAVSRLRRRPMVFRQFGGEFHRTFAGLGRARRWLVRHTVLATEVVMLQTLEQVQALAPHCRAEPHWFPTARAASDLIYEGRFAHGRSTVLNCLYIGHVRRLKGVLDAATATKPLPEVRFHVYGPLVDVSEEDLRRAGAEYHGEVRAADVPALMARHDLLLLPTRYPGEGYPGVLVEAALAGLPVIATRWQALPEMFPGEEVLWLADSGTDAIAAAVTAVSRREVDLLAHSAQLRARSRAFEADVVFGRFLDACAVLAVRQPSLAEGR